jgi:hypothetical protein
MKSAIASVVTASLMAGAAAAPTADKSYFLTALGAMSPDEAVFALTVDAWLEARCGKPQSATTLREALGIHTEANRSLRLELTIAMKAGRIADAQRALARVSCEKT